MQNAKLKCISATGSNYITLRAGNSSFAQHAQRIRNKPEYHYN